MIYMQKFLVAVMCDTSVIGDGSVYVILNEVRYIYTPYLLVTMMTVLSW